MTDSPERSSICVRLVLKPEALEVVLAEPTEDDKPTTVENNGPKTSWHDMGWHSWRRLYRPKPPKSADYKFPLEEAPKWR